MVLLDLLCGNPWVAKVSVAFHYTIVAEEVDQVPDRFFFMDGSLSMEKKEEDIMIWVQEQVDLLLSQNEEKILKADKGVLGKEDFLILVNIIENRVKTFLSEEKFNNQKKRETVI